MFTAFIYSTDTMTAVTSVHCCFAEQEARESAIADYLDQMMRSCSYDSEADAMRDLVEDLADGVIRLVVNQVG